MADAQLTHAGAAPASLAWALSLVRVDPQGPLPEGASPEHIDEFRRELIRQLTSMALPREQD